MNSSSHVLCIPAMMRIEMGSLLLQVNRMLDEQEQSFAGFLEDAYFCLSACSSGTVKGSSLLQACVVMMTTALGRAYLRSDTANPLARHTKRLVSQLRARAAGHALRHSRARIGGRPGVKNPGAAPLQQGSDAVAQPPASC